MSVLFKRPGVSICVFLCLFVAKAHAQSLTIESWRTDDKAIWEEKIIPVFEAANPGIFLNFEPTEPTEYNEALTSRLEEGSAGDLIVCRAYTPSLRLYENDFLKNLAELEGLSHFSPKVRASWTAGDGDDTFCVPMVSVFLAFIYNKDAFQEIGLDVPETEEQFYAALEKIKNESSYLPLAIGTHDAWTTVSLAFRNIGHTYWGSEPVRQDVISRKAKMTDEPFVEVLRQISRWSPYMGDDYQDRTYSDSQLLFTLGRGVIYPAGSWEIAGFQENSLFELGVFPAPKIDEDGECYFGNYHDMGIGMNSATEHPEAAMKFLQWTTTAEFAELLTNSLPGFFHLSDHDIKTENSLVREFTAIPSDCKTSPWLHIEPASPGNRSLPELLAEHVPNVMNGTTTPEEAATAIQESLDGG